MCAERQSNPLAIIPDLTHYEAFANTRMAETALPFLNGESNTRTSAERVKAQPPTK